MKKLFKYYAAVWAVMFVIFNGVCFFTPNKLGDLDKFGGAFWTGYVFITLAFIGQLACAYIALKDNSSQKLFYHLPLITISYTGLIVTLIFGSLTMIIPNLPNWVGIIVCLLILAFCAVSVIKAGGAAEAVAQTDEKIAVQTSVIRSMTADAQALMAYADDTQIQADCKKVYEALRYSDPMSNGALVEINNRLSDKMYKFSEFVKVNDVDNANALADEILRIINERNIKCKQSKQ